jgi:hypothetical protein
MSKQCGCQANVDRLRKLSWTRMLTLDERAELRHAKVKAWACDQFSDKHCFTNK